VFAEAAPGWLVMYTEWVNSVPQLASQTSLLTKRLSTPPLQGAVELCQPRVVSPSRTECSFKDES
jgi:hypothetical protein